MILQHKRADDFVIATGEQHSVREFCTLAFAAAGIQIEWKGKGIREKGIVASASHELGFLKKGATVIEIDPRYFRPTEVDTLLGNPNKARKELGWVHEIQFDDLVTEMVQEDMKIAQRDKALRENGFNIRNGLGE